VLALKIVPEHLSTPDTRKVLDFALRQTRKKSTSLKPRPVANVRQGTRKPDGRHAPFSECWPCQDSRAYQRNFVNQGSQAVASEPQKGQRDGAFCRKPGGARDIPLCRLSR
jgi:hypothetical protein